jgi:hypothetical protein
MRWPAGLILGVAALGLGCDDAGKSKAVAPPPPGSVEHGGKISGRVIFVGAPPTLPRIPVTGDAHCMSAHPDGVPDESVVVAGDGAIANAFVYIKDAPPSDGSAREPGAIDQVGCQYVPHVVGVQINQSLQVKSSDSILHNVHVLGIENPAMNLSVSGIGRQSIRFAKPEMLHVRCDVHPWMKAIVGVFESPWFAVTGTDGSFVIKDVPPGTYTLAVWQERFGEQTRRIIIAPDGSVDGSFSYRP